jgi:hypothetical protein
MAYNPNDPYSPNDPYRADDEYRREARLDNELQADPELAEGPASGSKVAIYAVAIALVLGAVIYGMNSPSMNQAGTASTAQNAPQVSPPPAPPGMRDVTPRANTEPGVTTGAAPVQPAQPPQAGPIGPDVNRNGNPSTDTTNAPANK